MLERRKYWRCKRKLQQQRKYWPAVQLHWSQQFHVQNRNVQSALLPAAIWSTAAAAATAAIVATAAASVTGTPVATATTAERLQANRAGRRTAGEQLHQHRLLVQVDIRSIQGCSELATRKCAAGGPAAVVRPEAVAV